MKPNLFVTFTVEVGDSQYSYSGNCGSANLAIQIPRSLLVEIEPTALFRGIVNAALINFDRVVLEARLKEETDESTESTESTESSN